MRYPKAFLIAATLVLSACATSSKVRQIDRLEDVDERLGCVAEHLDRVDIEDLQVRCLDMGYDEVVHGHPDRRFFVENDGRLRHAAHGELGRFERGYGTRG